MAEVNVAVPSGAMTPDSKPPPSPPTKRRRSSTTEGSPKRPRLSSDAHSRSPPVNASTTVRTSASEQEHRNAEPARDRRKASIQEERKRGQRLFGGLISTLSQTTPNNQQKRRQEIERRQQDRVKQQKVVDEGKKKERLANLQVIRKAEQIKYDRQTMKIRHSNMLAMANFLSTKTEPKLYYKPWELQPAQEELIKQQLSDTQAQIDHEVAEFARRHPRTSDDGSGLEKEGAVPNGKSENRPVGEQDAVSPPISNSLSNTNDVSADVDTTNTSSTVQASHDQNSSPVTAQEEHNGEVLMENDEDAVIY